MPRRYLTFIPGENYHFYNRGENRGTVFFCDKNYHFFLFNIERYVQPIMELVAYCLMPTHYHLLIRVRETSEVSTAMMKLSVSYTKAINHAYDRVGPIFQGAFQAKHIDSAAYLRHLVGYIHLNPVQSGLVQCPDEWDFSSFSVYQDLEPGDPDVSKRLNDLRGL